jgi:homogentisate 1,2-dioxygenase
MPYYRQAGELPRKRHVQFRRPDGGLYAEELMGEEGFSADSSLLYHRYAPAAIIKAEAAAEPAGSGALEPNYPLRPRSFRTQDLPAGGDLVTGRQLLLGNGDIRIGVAAGDTDSPLYRDATGDILYYVQEGRARCESSFGVLEAAAGDYLLMPAGTIHRFVAGGSLVQALVIEARGHVGPPARYLSARGQFLEHAPYCERDLRAPDTPLPAEGEEVPVLVRTSGGLTWLTYARHPFDVVGWDGCLYPYVFSIGDFEPVVKRTHAPPPVHQTFAGPNFVVCSFCPRPLDFDPDAVPVPYHHHNVDSDEMMFYSAGNYAARAGSGIEIGSVSLHPAGFTHGPQPGAAEAAVEGLAAGRTTTDETAVMVDTFRPLLLGPAARDCEDPGYAWTWAR